MFAVMMLAFALLYGDTPLGRFACVVVLSHRSIDLLFHVHERTLAAPFPLEG